MGSMRSPHPLPPFHPKHPDVEFAIPLGPQRKQIGRRLVSNAYKTPFTPRGWPLALFPGT